MNENLGNKYFIILNKDKIIFNCLNDKNKISFAKKYNLKDKNLNNLYSELENFLSDNLIQIEKKLDNYIQKIYFIVNTNDTLSASLSISYNLKTETATPNKIGDLLKDLKYQFTKYNDDYKIIHMTISKSLVNKENISIFAKDMISKNFILEVKFECLKKQIVNVIQKSLSKYQISVEKFFVLDYLKEINQNYSENILCTANKVINGQIDNEVLLITKKLAKNSFFERFFSYFK